MVSLRNFVKSVATVLPEIPKPIKKPTLTEKFIWTGGALVIYMIMSITPLFHFGNQQDQFAFLRIIFASTQGTLTELGIGPIVTAGLILQLLQGSDILRLDLGNPDDRALFGTATKLLTFLVIAIESGAYIIGGALGTLQTTQAIVIFFQLFGASVIILLLDEMIQKGWGIGSGISLFILAGVAQTLWWDSFSPYPVAPTQGAPTQIYGFIPALVNSLFSGAGVSSVLIRASQFPSAFTFVMTIAVILFITYIEGIRVEVPITSVKYRGFQGVYPIKLLYVSNIPVILVSALTANISFFTRLLHNYVGSTPPSWMHYLVTYDTNFNPTGGLVYYITPPNGIAQTTQDPLHAVIYCIFLMCFAVMFARIWVEIGGLSSRTVAKNLMNADVQVPGFRRAGLSIEQVLNRYIPPITVIGGLIIGSVAAISDVFGVFGTGVGLLLGVDIVLQYYQMLVKEQLEEFSPRLAGVLGQA
ncbi:MAG TPA: preprotein translocase subunit SecY [Nitrososphaerales archaeon]|nr:preprotein translocase subunit SecY [Nitrososphaerales archaeon]HUK74418.1 preprotein translocase subunit SecY [Nitrososphaerales archaeon]